MGLLADHRARRVDLLDGSISATVIEGPPTQPPARTSSGTAGARPPNHPSTAAVDRHALPTDRRRRYRVPALLAWLALADGTGVLGTAVVEIDLDRGQRMELKVSDGDVMSCELRSATGCDRVVAPASAASARLLDLLG